MGSTKEAMMIVSIITLVFVVTTGYAGLTGLLSIPLMLIFTVVDLGLAGVLAALWLLDPER